MIDKTKTPLQVAEEHEKRISSLEMTIQGALAILLARQIFKNVRSITSIGRDLLEKFNQLNK